MSSAFESDASFPIGLAADDAGGMWAIDVGVSSFRKRLKKPPLFFLSLSAVVSGTAGCAGGAHSSARALALSLAGDSGCGAGAPHGFTSAGGSFGFAVGAQAFEGASFDAGGAVIHDSAGVPGAGAPCGGAPPPGARHQSFSLGFASAACAGGVC